jgi:hypothetical protein
MNVSFSRLDYSASFSVKFVMKMSKRRAENLTLGSGPNILKKEKCYIKRLEVIMLQIFASMYT